MIIIDNFILDQDLLDRINNDDSFMGSNARYMWWDGWWNNEAKTIKQELIQYIWRDNCPLSDKLSISGFEYWTGTYGEGKGVTSLDYHFDKDELHWERTGGNNGGEVVRPVIGTVFYPKPMDIDGGYLEIHSRGDDEVERIEAKYNRLVIFDAGNHRHRVTEVTRGIRYAIAINLWEDELVMVKEGSNIIDEGWSN